jgi:hypothetical protein
MTDCWVAPESLFNGQDIVCGQAVRIVDGRITEIAKNTGLSGADQRLSDTWLR